MKTVFRTPDMTEKKKGKKEKKEKKQKREEEVQPSASFSSLVLMLATGALQQMGIVENPLTKKKEKDLTMAKLTIDTLQILKDKTKGNLERDEEQMMEELLAELKLNYVKVSG